MSEEGYGRKESWLLVKPTGKTMTDLSIAGIPAEIRTQCYQAETQKCSNHYETFSF
jgi:hypothetical protein